MSKKILFFIVIAFVFACNTTVENKDFSIYIPKQLKVTDQIIDSAELQYTDNKLFVAVEKSDKKIGADSFCSENIYSLFDFINKIDTTTIISKYGAGKEIEINEGVMNDKYNWKIKVLPKDNYYFVLWVWTSANDYKNNKSVMEKIVKSFKLK